MEDNQKVNKIDEPGILYPQVLKTKEIQGWDFHQNQSNPGENIESIVGSCGYNTSTFGNKKPYRRIISNPNDLKNEETLDISHQVLQMIANTKIDNDYSHEHINH